MDVERSGGGGRKASPAAKACILRAVGNALTSCGRAAEATAPLEESVELLRQVDAREDDVPLLELVHSIDALAVNLSSLHGQGVFDTVLDLQREALHAEAAVSGRDSIAVASRLSAIGALLSEKQPERALDALEEAAATFEKRADEAALKERATCLRHLGDVETLLGRMPEARKAYTTARGILLGSNMEDPIIALDMMELRCATIMSFVTEEKHEDARVLLEQQLPGVRAAVGDRHPLTVRMLVMAAECNHHLRRLDEAATLYADAQKVLRSIRRSTQPDMVGVHERYMRCLLRLGRLDDAAAEARAHADAARSERLLPASGVRKAAKLAAAGADEEALHKAFDVPRASDEAGVAFEDGEVALEGGRYVEAYAAFTTALDKGGAWLTPRRRADTLYRRAYVCVKLDLHEQAIADAQASLEADPGTTSAYAATAMALSALGRKDEAAEQYKLYGNALFKGGSGTVRSLKAYDAAVAENPRLAAAHLNRGVMLTMQNDLSRARAAFETALLLAKEQGDAVVAAKASKRLAGPSKV